MGSALVEELHEDREAPHRYVEHEPGVQGGRPVIRGHRIPISSLVLNHQQDMSVEGILDAFS